MKILVKEKQLDAYLLTCVCVASLVLVAIAVLASAFEGGSIGAPLAFSSKKYLLTLKITALAWLRSWPYGELEAGECSIVGLCACVTARAGHDMSGRGSGAMQRQGSPPPLICHA